MSSNRGQVRIAMRDKHYNSQAEIQGAAVKAGLDLIPDFSGRKSQRYKHIHLGCSSTNLH